jgi:hypothetical protein
MHGTEFHVIQRLHQLFVEGFVELVERSETNASGDLEVAGDTIHAPDVTEAPVRLDPNRFETSSALEGIVPIALPHDFALEDETLSIVEKYIITLCDGTRDLQRITAVAPIQSHIVIDTIQSLTDRGWLKANARAADNT